jgi:hypothetical protein
MRFGFPAGLRLCVPALLLPVLLLPLAGCGPGRNEFAPLCPSARLERSLADLTRFAGAGPGHDITDLILQARITQVDGSCQPTDAKTTLGATVRITISVQRGPAMRGREADVPVFVAVAQGDTVRDKQLIPVHLVFPPNDDRLTLTSQPIDLALPVNQDVNGASYQVIAGFQLSPDELSANRQAKGG